MTAFSTSWSLRRVARWALVGVAAYGVLWLLWSARSALTPFILGVILAYLLLPLVNALGVRMPRWLAILLVYIGGIGLTAGIFAFFIPPLTSQIGQLIRSIPDLNTIQGWSNMLLDEYEQLLATLPPDLQAEVETAVSSLISQGATTLRTNFVDYLQSLGTFLLNSVLSVVNTVTFLLGFFLIPFWLFYVLMDQREGAAALDRALPGWLRADFWGVTTIIDRDFSGYLRGQLILGLAVGSAAGSGLFVLSLFGLQVEYILLLAVIAGITELIPVIGPIVGSIPAIILGFIDSPTTGVAVLILYVAIQQLENNFLVPRIVGDSVGLHPAVLMVLLVVCSQVFGLAGAILSAPMGAVARDVFSYLYGRLSDPPRPAGELPARLRAAEPALRPPAPVVAADPAPAPPGPALTAPEPEPAPRGEAPRGEAPGGPQEAL